MWSRGLVARGMVLGAGDGQWRSLESNHPLCTAEGHVQQGLGYLLRVVGPMDVNSGGFAPHGRVGSRD